MIEDLEMESQFTGIKQHYACIYITKLCIFNVCTCIKPLMSLNLVRSKLELYPD